MAGDEVEPDGSVTVLFNDGSFQRFNFSEPGFYSHGFARAHVKVNGVVVEDGPLVYQIVFDNHRVTIPLMNIKSISLYPNSKEYTDWFKAQCEGR